MELSEMGAERRPPTEDEREDAREQDAEDRAREAWSPLSRRDRSAASLEGRRRRHFNRSSPYWDGDYE